MIVAIGFRVRSNVGTNFRKWANDRLKEYMIKGFTMNDDLLKRAGGGIYFDELLELEILGQVKKFFGEKFWIYTQHLLIMIQNQKLHKNFLRQYRIKCIGLYMDIQHQKLF